MYCKICNSTDITIEWKGKLRVSVKPFIQTDEEYEIHRCSNCGVMFHNYALPLDYYSSETYRNDVDNKNDVETYYANHDKDVAAKLSWTGTDIFRNKVVLDVGAGGGSFIDFVKGAAKRVIAVEPNEEYRLAMKDKNIICYDYLNNCVNDLHEKVDVITSFDCMEHVNDPGAFAKDIFKLLKPGGIAIIGVPSDYPLLRNLVGRAFEERVVFLTVHPFIFNENSLNHLFSITGFISIAIEQKMLYGISNAISWLKNKDYSGNTKDDTYSETLNSVWKSELLANGMGEYLLLKAKKPLELTK